MFVRRVRERVHLGNRCLAYVIGSAYNRRKMRYLPYFLTILLVAFAVEAGATPPVVRAPSAPMLHAISETTRGLQRELRQLDPARKKLRTKIIVLDPGHGGRNLGAVGVANVREKLITLDLAYELRDAIEAKYPDVTVLLTRYWDRGVGLNERTDWANANGAELFLSLHYNAAGHDRAIGHETFFLSEETMAATAERGNRAGQNSSPSQRRAGRLMDRARERAHLKARKLLEPAHKQSIALAAIVQGELTKRLDSMDRGVRQANFAVLRGAKMPAVVIESGFLTHPVEGRAVLRRPHRDAVVAAILAAIEAYDATRPKPKRTEAPAVSSTSQ